MTWIQLSGLYKKATRRLKAEWEILPYAGLRASQRAAHYFTPHLPPPEALAFLDSLDCDHVEHAGKTLREHLINTYRLLDRWGNDRPTCLAGLFHATYGTSTLGGRLLELSERERLRFVIGSEAEQLVYYYGLLDRAHLQAACQGGDFFVRLRTTGDRVALSQREFGQLAEIFLADRLEQIFMFNYRVRDQSNDFFTQARPLLSDRAWADYCRAFPRRSSRAG